MNVVTICSSVNLNSKLEKIEKVFVLLFIVIMLKSEFSMNKLLSCL